ncbi:GNAT family N-acetyltransferase [Sphingobacteriaceae bacterium]|nr:GNAT family N-acetyltransferase [Sphingobacteriaceae bacterium]
MKKITIIKIESPKSLPSCAEVLVNAYNSEPWNDEWTKDKALEKLMCFYNSPKFLGWMAYENDKLLGCCVGNIEPYFSGDYFYLKEMFVSFDAQHKGIGRELMNVLTAELERININAIILFTSSEFFPFEFYNKVGFNEMEGMKMMHRG